jgi:O-antigen ligase
VPVTAANWSRRPSPALWPNSGLFYNDLALAVLSSSAMITVSLVGSLPGCEIVALFMAPFLLLRHPRRALRHEHLGFYFFLGLWLFGTVVADLYLGSSMVNSAKGIARVIFLGLDFTAVAILVNRKTRGVVVFTLGFVPVMLYIAAAFRADFLVAWKFGLGYAITLVALLISCRFYQRQRYWVCVAISLGMAGLNLIFAARSQVAIDLISLVLVLPILRGRDTLQRGKLGRTARARTVVLLVLAGGAAYLANQAIRFGASHNFFDESIQDKFQTQEEGKLGVLVGGRPETLVAIQAIRDSPIIGHGSFAVDPKYNWLQQDIEYENGYVASDVPPDEDAGIPAHSHLTQSWIESGVFGGIFWIYVLCLTARALFRLVSQSSTMAPLYSFLLVGFIWDIFYSPMGSFDRLWGAFAIVIVFDLLRAPNLGERFVRRGAAGVGRQTIEPHRCVVKQGYVVRRRYLRPGGRPIA